MSNNYARVEIKVIGRVQGVFFRQSVQGLAEKLRVFGWVQNEPDGAVRIIAEGEGGNLEELIAYCRHGTDWSRVDDVEVRRGEPTGEFTAFEIK